MYEITIRIKSPGQASQLISMIVRSESYDHVEGIHVARVSDGDLHRDGGEWRPSRGVSAVPSPRPLRKEA